MQNNPVFANALIMNGLYTFLYVGLQTGNVINSKQ